MNLSPDTALWRVNKLGTTKRALNKHLNWIAACQAGPAPDVRKMPSKAAKLRMYGELNWVLRTLGLTWDRANSLAEVGAQIARVEAHLATLGVAVTR